ncbi:ketosteroid isomerase-like protein [Kribbella steppae]|uniref:Ketosteroid isomerase-like protein n=1 Tax=Kribbella steppae TaxID=2512223 RepID=A0A4R2H4G3_9ACTN|nr:nuclear transport factor 2 family protein [Kribbella steppae]TCO20472.1 ketosteroid isomerase-like protein [Kribbella steppae]
MTTQSAVDEVDIRERIDTLVESVRTRDLDGIKTIFAPNLVSFDIEPPLRHLGAEAKWNNWTKVFTVYTALDYEIRDLTVVVGGDLAVAYSINHISGTLQSGDTNEYWLRWTAVFRKVDGTWLITHDQVSVPTDFATGQSKLDLVP